MAASGFLALWAWLAPGLAFLILSLVFPFRRSGKPAAWLSIVVSLGSLVGAVTAWRATVPDMARRLLWDWIPVEDGVLTAVGVLVDADATLMLILVALVSFLVQVYSLGYLADEPPASLGRYYTYQSLFAFSMMGLVLAPNFVQLFICWELVGLCSYLLIGYWYARPEAARAAVKAFWVTKAGDVGFLIGIVMLWSRTGTFAFSALFEATLACVQRDIKRVLAYSTVSQLGYMMAAIGAGFASAGFLHLLTHGVFKALLFLAAGAVIHAVGTNDIHAMGGLARRMPQTFIVFLVGTLSLAGIPLFAGFFSKEEILSAAWAGGLTVPFAMLVAAAFLTAFYMFRVVFVAFMGAPAGSAAHGSGPGGHDAAHAHDAPAIMTVPLWILALLAMVIGVGFARSHPEAEFVAPDWLTSLAVGAALGGIVLSAVVYALGWISPAWIFRRLAVVGDAAMERFWLDDFFALLYRRGILELARIVGWVDRYIVDGVVNVLSAWTLTLGDRLRRIQSGQAQDYVYGIALGVLLLMVWMRWPR